ncbi:MAG: hypothetical protein LAT84_09910 [Balneolia bacterium]|nr:hypothetical protein [Balneolia bacterium]
MKSLLLLIALSFAFTFVMSTDSAAQTVTFELDLSSQIADSTFVPDRDVALLRGTSFPLNAGQHILKPAEEEHVYELQIDFSFAQIGEGLEFLFVLETENETVEEQMPRRMQIPRGGHTIRSFFNSFNF